MDNPLTFLLVILGAFFALWLIGGGPNRAISFSGPYITPITDVGEGQAGYGPQIKPAASVTLPGGASASVSEKNTTAAKTVAAATPKVSTYSSQVSITRSTVASAQNPNSAYVELMLTSHISQSLTLSGWKLVSANGGTVLIKNGASSSVTLSPNQSALIVTTFLSSAPHDTINLLDGSGAIVSTTSY
jgi:hypothetical protein